MNAGSLLVVLGLVCAVISMLLGWSTPTRPSHPAWFPLLAFGVVLIGVGVLVGVTPLLK